MVYTLDEIKRNGLKVRHPCELKERNSKSSTILSDMSYNVHRPPSHLDVDPTRLVSNFSIHVYGDVCVCGCICAPSGCVTRVGRLIS